MIKQSLKTLLLALLMNIGGSFVLNTRTAQAAGNTYYIATNGRDSNPGTLAAPWATLAHALTTVSAGDQVLMRGGTYDQYLYVDPFYGTLKWIASGTSWANKIRIAHYPGETAWLAPSSSPFGVLTIRGDFGYLEFDGINIDGSNPNIQNDVPVLFDFEDGGAYRVPHHIRFMNAEVIGYPLPGGASAILLGGHVLSNAQGGFEILNNKIHSAPSYGIYIATPNSLIDGNEIYDIGTYGVHIWNGGGDDANNITVSNNIIHDLKFGIFQSGDPNPGKSGILAGPYVNQLIYNNVIYNIDPAGTGTDNSGIAVYHSASNTQIYNNTIVGAVNGRGIALSNWGGPTVGTVIKNNIFSNNGAGDIDDSYGVATMSNNLCGATGPGCQSTGNPNFVNPSVGDFHLKPGSPAIDTGANLSSVFTTDIAGVTRPQGSAYDKGAYEYGGSASYSCSGGTLCNGTPVTGTPNQVVCGTDFKNWQCASSAGWTALGTSCTCDSFSACDVNQTGGSANIADVQLTVNQVLQTPACVPFGQPGSADINQDGKCTIVDVQRVVNAALGGQCVTP